MARSKRAGQFTLLGRTDAKLPASPSDARLETFPNPAPNRNYRIHFETDDFTSVCPASGQPDFARTDIDYAPARLCIGSKSLNIYLATDHNKRAINQTLRNRMLHAILNAYPPREGI